MSPLIVTPPPPLKVLEGVIEYNIYIYPPTPSTSKSGDIGDIIIYIQKSPHTHSINSKFMSPVFGDVMVTRLYNR